MPSDSFRRRFNPKLVVGDRCKQCLKEARILERADGLGKNCAHYADTTAKEVAEAKAASEKVRKGG